MEAPAPAGIRRGREPSHAEQTQEDPAEFLRVVPDDTLLDDERLGHGGHPEAGDGFQIRFDRRRTLPGIGRQEIGRDGFRVHQDQIDEAFAAVLEEGAHMITGRVIRRFPGLGHGVADIEADAWRLPDSLGDPPHQQVRDHTGVKAPRSEDDGVRLGDREDGLGNRPAVRRVEAEMPDADPLLAQARLPAHLAPVAHRAHERYILQGRRKDLAPDGQNLAGLLDRPLEVPGNAGHGREEKVAEIMAGQPRPSLEPVLHEALHKRFQVGHGDEAVADVARRQDAELPAEPARASAVVGHGHDGGEIVRDVLETPDDGRETRSAADDHDPGPMCRHRNMADLPDPPDERAPDIPPAQPSSQQARHTGGGEPEGIPPFESQDQAGTAGKGGQDDQDSAPVGSQDGFQVFTPRRLRPSAPMSR